MLQDLGVEGGNQRGALAACRDVAAAKVGDDRDAGEFGKQGGIADLQGVAVCRAMAQGLAVAADCAYRAGKCFKDRLGCAGVQTSQFIARAGGKMDLVGLRSVQRQ